MDMTLDRSKQLLKAALAYAINNVDDVNDCWAPYSNEELFIRAEKAWEKLKLQDEAAGKE